MTTYMMAYYVKGTTIYMPYVTSWPPFKSGQDYLVGNLPVGASSLRFVFTPNIPSSYEGKHAFFRVGDIDFSLPIHRNEVPSSPFNFSTPCNIYLTAIGDKFHIETSSNSGGSITPSFNVVAGDDAFVSIIPDDGYEVADVFVDGVSVGAVTEYSFVNVQSDHTVEAVFSSYCHINTSAGAHGSITPSFDVAHGDDASVVITPDFGFHVGYVLVDGVSVGAVNSYTFSNVQDDHTISVIFIPNAATHFVARWEFAQELPGGGWYRESGITPLSVGSIASTSYFGSNTLYADILRIRFCDSAGNLQKFSGNISGLNSVNGDGEEDQNSQTFVTPELVDSTSVILLRHAIASGADFVGGEGYKFNLVIGGLTSELVEEHSPEGEIEPEVLPEPVLPLPDDITEPEPVIPPVEPSAPFPPTPLPDDIVEPEPVVPPVEPSAPFPPTPLPDDIVEPEPVVPPVEPSAPFPPIIPFPPEQPQTGCECEIYSSQLISRAIDSLSAYLRNDMSTLEQRLKWLGDYLPSLFETLTKVSVDATNAQIKMSACLHSDMSTLEQRLKWLGDYLPSLFETLAKVSVDATNAQIKMSEYLADRDAMLFDRFEILFKRALMSDTTDQAKGLTESLRESLIDSDSNGLTESLRESLIDSDGIGFADKFQPVVIENEFRTQSHRLVDDIDTTINI